MTEATLKTLEKMTRTKLIEEAHETHGIEGAHGMSKEQLIAAITAAMKEAGTWVEGEQKPAVRKIKKAVVDKATLKKRIHEAKKQRNEALAAGQKEAFVLARTRLNRLKGRLRRLKVLGAV